MSTEFSSSVLPMELPRDGSALRVSIGLPSINFASKQLRRRDSAIQALPPQDTDFDLCHGLQH